jgi:hypothetical protein
VSVFWLWREIVLKMRTPFYKKSYWWVTFLWSTSRCLFFVRPNTLLLYIVLFCIYLLYHTDPQVEVQIRILLKDKYEIVSIMRTPAIPLWFPKKWLFDYFILEKQLASQNMFLVKSELSITTYLFLVFYRSTSYQSRSFLKNIKTFLCK